jgi:hypothetical protein
LGHKQLIQIGLTVDGQDPVEPSGNLTAARQKQPSRFPQFFPQHDGNLAVAIFALRCAKNESFLPHLNVCDEAGFKAGAEISPYESARPQPRHIFE